MVDDCFWLWKLITQCSLRKVTVLCCFLSCLLMKTLILIGSIFSHYLSFLCTSESSGAVIDKIYNEMYVITIDFIHHCSYPYVYDNNILGGFVTKFMLTYHSLYNKNLHCYKFPDFGLPKVIDESFLVVHSLWSDCTEPCPAYIPTRVQIFVICEVKLMVLAS